MISTEEAELYLKSIKLTHFRNQIITIIIVTVVATTVEMSFLIIQIFNSLCN